MSDKPGLRPVGLQESRFEGQDHADLVRDPRQAAGPGLVPRPDLWSDIVDDRYPPLMCPFGQRQVESGIVDRDQQVDVFAEDELPYFSPQPQQVWQVLHDLGETQDCQPVQSGEQFDSGRRHLTSTQTGKPDPRDSPTQGPRKLSSVLIARRLTS